MISIKLPSITTLQNLFLSIFIYVFLFLYIYSPRWIKGIDFVTNSYFWGWIFSIIVLYKSYKTILEEIKTSQIYTSYIILIVCATIYFSIVHLIMGKNININSMRLIQGLYPIVSLFNLTFIVYIMQKLGYNKHDGINVFLNLAAFQGVICILMLIIPSFKDFANYLFINAGAFKEGDYIFTTRGYGIAADYTYGLPIMHGILCGISIYVGLSYKKIYIYLTLFIFLSVFLNGRTGLAIAIITMFLTLIARINFTKSFFKAIINMFLLVIFTCFLLYKFDSLIPPNVTRFASGLFIQIKDKNENINYLFNSHLFFPSGMSLFFGEGHSVYGVNALNYGYKATDIGYVNDLFMGGLIYLAFRYSAVFLLIIGSFNNRTKFDNVISIILIIGWIISCIKGQSTTNPMIISCVQYLFLVRHMLVA